MKKLFFVFCLITSIPTFAQTMFEVRLAFNGYTGLYYLHNPPGKPIKYTGKGSVDEVFRLKQGTYDFEIGSVGYVNAQIKFTIEPSGKVNINTNPEAVTLKDTIIIGKKIPKIVFNTDSVTIKPNGAPYLIYAFYDPPKYKYQSNTQPKTFTLVRSISYILATGKTSSRLPNGDGKKTYPTESFIFHLDKQRKVRADNSLKPNDILSATYEDNVVSFNTVEINIDPKMYNVNKLTILGLGDIKKPSTIKLIKGIGTAIFYPTKNMEALRMHLLIPF